MQNRGYTEEAVQSLKTVLEDKTFNENYYVKAIFTLTREYYNLGADELAAEYFTYGLDYANKIKNREYQIKLKLLWALKTENNFEMVFKEGFS